MFDSKQLGKRIREARLRSGLSQQELAAAIGVSDKTISAYEVGRVDPPLESLDKLGTATKHPVGYFIGDVTSNVEARLNRIISEMSAIKDALKAATAAGAAQQAQSQSGSTPPPAQDPPTEPPTAAQG